MTSDFERKAHNETIREILTKLDRHAPGERAHGERVAVYSLAVATELDWSEEDMLALRYAAELHDVGKLSVDSSLLSAIGKIDDEAFERMKQHAEKGFAYLKSLPWLAPSLPFILHHHERYDGKGYPAGLAGDAIPDGARIICVAEALDCMLHPPHWKFALSEDQAFAELREGAGSHFDPEIVRIISRISNLIQPLV